MRAVPIRTRLTVWYFLVLAGAMIGFAVFALQQMRASIHTAVDEQLEDQARDITSLIARSSDESMADELREHAELQSSSQLFQASDDSGRFIYRSRLMERLGIPAGKAGQPQVSEAMYGDLPVRVRTTTATAGTRHFVIQVAEPMDDFQEALDRFRSALCLLIPLLLLIAGGGGYWLSSLALRPVDQMTRAAQTITPQDLSRRVTVPPTSDELQRLAETLNKMLERIEGAVRRITEFTADASHELRTPVTLIRTRAEVTLGNPRTNEEYREALQDVLAESERVSSLIENLMLLARADAGTERLRFEDIDLTEVAREVSTQAWTLAEGKQLRWATELHERPIWVHGDQRGLRRLLLILIDNAVKYTPSGGRVSLAVGQNGRHAEIRVQDTGIGISELDQPHVFERFYRADKARSRDLGGDGLGLSIGRWIADAHGGEITVESSSSGSTFRVRLPIIG